MKKFNNFNDCFKWIKNSVEKTNDSAKEKIARQCYEDSKKYTYIDTEKMYNTGKDSDFKDGFVLIKGPQVRWLYYTTWIKPHKNRNAVPQWFETTKNENMKIYVNKYIEIFKTTLRK